MTPGERLQWKIVHRMKEDIEADIDTLLQVGENGVNRNDTAVGILNHVLLPAMKEVGDKFGRGELILPFCAAIRRGDEKSRPTLKTSWNARKAPVKANSCWRPCTVTYMISVKTWSRPFSPIMGTTWLT